LPLVRHQRRLRWARLHLLLLVRIWVLPRSSGNRWGRRLARPHRYAGRFRVVRI